jgi:hypothetical protein
LFPADAGDANGKRMADNTAAIAAIQIAIKTGATRVVIDGQSVEVSPAYLRRALRELLASDTGPNASANNGIRPPASTIYLGGF